ncbi:MAG: hypothetical protein HY843_01305, partial [Bdellovibrio sp.]|nr:hypothetical protein [Bdellovibrio sp.]
CELFVLHRLSPYPSSRGKPIYLILDPGIADYLGASLTRKLHITLLNERLCKNTYTVTKKKQFYYYRSIGKNFIHLIEEDLDGKREAFQLFDIERIKKPDLELMHSFLTRNSNTTGSLYAPVPETMIIKKIHIHPWENMAVGESNISPFLVQP